MKKLLKISIVLTLLSVQFIHAQGPWTREKGKAYVQLGFSGIFYDKYANNDSKIVDLDANVSDITTQVYAEYGFTAKLEAQLILPFKSVSYQAKEGGNSQSLSGIGNVSLGLKYKVLDKNWKISTGLFFSANSIAKNTEKGLTTGFNASTILPYVSFGSSAGKWYYYGNIGYGYMSNNYSDFLRIAAEVGYNVIEKGHLIFVLDTKNIVSKESAFDNELNQWASYSDRQSFSAIGLKFNYEFTKDKFGANFAALGAAALSNAPAAPSFNLGVYAKL
jgi:hypothetical protein